MQTRVYNPAWRLICSPAVMEKARWRQAIRQTVESIT